MVAMMDGRMRGGGSGVSSWLVTVIIVLALLQLHLMVGVDAGRQMPRQLLHESCLKDRKYLFGRLLLKTAAGHRGPPSPIGSPPTTPINISSTPPPSQSAAPPPGPE
ncbi:unnamed protein product [Sphagnum jensenii]|uniref:Uncharacterized protein n=1 Tax=Sphagnum jensenii TaxID=128206 RepID=A0ABP0WGK6_9BRYO